MCFSFSEGRYIFVGLFFPTSKAEHENVFYFVLLLSFLMSFHWPIPGLSMQTNGEPWQTIRVGVNENVEWSDRFGLPVYWAKYSPRSDFPLVRKSTEKREKEKEIFKVLLRMRRNPYINSYPQACAPMHQDHNSFGFRPNSAFIRFSHINQTPLPYTSFEHHLTLNLS